ncbi:ABC transporter ATP-binding protein [Niameybacter massiliensis]|uniref:ABC transporter ATP-binding protein n=1 Tax=Holtiella tumoricola TaxID=3018743 RepID=A0AA42DL60_9FIRM|nr:MULTISPECIES: ABC transporter ATP-binding protein [Lachnospirales]MDA3731076.1 ABC transporter ATP-binding protein [Holtiella tumoricola]
MQPILEIIDVRKNYGNKEALKGVSLRIEPGKVIGLLGPNGSGKSTLIKLINGLIQPTSGEIIVAGKTLGIETTKMISYLPERTYLNDWMKVKDLLGFFDDFYEDFDKDRAREMLGVLKIDEESKLKTLSKGTKEKVQLILVMSRKARLYILDEPIGGVDPAARDYILNTIIKNYSEDSSVIIATHLIQEVENICDDIIFLGYGEVMLQGNVDDIRAEKGQSIDSLFREVFRC